MPPKILSLQVGLPQTVDWHGQQVETGIFKSPVKGPVHLRTLNLDGDRQADLTVHGGPDKAVYVYASEHYAYWRSELPEVDFPWGAFGENFTTAGLAEDTVHIGDRFQIGAAEVLAVQPRMPCYKLGVKFGRDDMVKRFLHSMRLGYYLRVLKEGQVSPVAVFVPLHRDENEVKVLDIVRLYLHQYSDPPLLRRALSAKSLPAPWRHSLSPR